MGLIINTNISSLNAEKNLMVSNTGLSKSLERLSSGLRINKAGDDAAGLALSENMRAQVRSIRQSIRNANDGLSLTQVAEGSLSEVNNILTRLRELAVQSATSTLGNAERVTLDNEYQALKSEITRIAESTEFNGQRLINGALSGSAAALKFQVGINGGSNDRLTLQVSAVGASAISLHDTTNNAASITGLANAQSALASIDSAIDVVASMRGDIGAIQNRLSSTINNLANFAENLSAAESRIRDADFAVETATFTRNQIMVQAGTSILAQANQAPQLVLSLLK